MLCIHLKLIKQDINHLRVTTCLYLGDLFASCRGEVLFATGMRRSDAVRVRRQHLQRFEGIDWIVMTTHKNRNGIVKLTAVI